MSAEAFSLLTLNNAALTGPDLNEHGLLSLECVTVPMPQPSHSASEPARDVFLLLRVNAHELPLDPTKPVSASVSSATGAHAYTLRDPDDHALVLTLAAPPPGDAGAHVREDMDTFDAILGQYADVREGAHPGPPLPSREKGAARTQSQGTLSGSGSYFGKDGKGDANLAYAKYENPHEELRGRLVFINENTGEVVGELENHNISEDASVREKGKEDQPVVVEIPDSEKALDELADEDPHALFVRAIPPEDRDWITRSAELASHVIKGSTNLLLTTMTWGTTYYINHSLPHPSTSGHPPASSAPSTPGPGSRQQQPPPLPPRALVFLTSQNTRKSLATVHSASARAATISSKSMVMLDRMIRRGASTLSGRSSVVNAGASAPPAAVGGTPPVPGAFPGGAASSSSSTPAWQSPFRSRTAAPAPPHTPPTGDGLKPALPARAPSPSPPPPYAGYRSDPAGFDKPALPPRKGMTDVYDVQSPAGTSAAGPSTSSGVAATTTPGEQRPLKTHHRLLLSADLLLSTFDSSVRQFVQVGADNLGRAVAHKYGKEAAESAGLLTGTAKNVVAIYIDMRGVGRRAIIKRVGREVLKQRVKKVVSTTRKGE